MPTPANIKLIVLDVDGVLTDGGLYIDNDGKSSKKFNVKDGLGIKLAQRLGIQVAILTGKTSGVVHHRAVELGIEHVIQGSDNKGDDIAIIARQVGVKPSETAMVGDDLPDLPAFAVAGYRIAVGDAVEEVKANAHHTTASPGGQGAVREAIEHILKAQGKWRAAMATFQ